LEDRTRWYFATRSCDAKGQFLSHVAFGDFSQDMTNLLGMSQPPVIELGGLGSFDEHGIFPMNVSLLCNGNEFGRFGFGVARLAG